MSADELMEDAVCDSCGNIGGLPGDTCPFCGGTYRDLSVGIDDVDLDGDEPETYPLEAMDDEESAKKGEEDESF